MYRTNSDIDIILDILKALLALKPSPFVQSLYEQYCERGSLSKKQLEGLHSKASKVPEMHPGKLATLQAIINKKTTKHRSEAPKEIVIPIKDEKAGTMISDILSKYPQHKRVLFFKAKDDKNDLLTPVEIAELERFHKLLIK